VKYVDCLGAGGQIDHSVCPGCILHADFVDASANGLQRLPIFRFQSALNGIEVETRVPSRAARLYPGGKSVGRSIGVASELEIGGVPRLRTLKPIVETQAFHSFEFGHVVRDKHDIEAQRVTGNQRVERTDGRTSGFQLGAHFAVRIGR